MDGDASASPDSVGRALPRVIFVNRYFHPDHSATSQMVSDLAFALAARGWRVEVFASRQTYDRPDERLVPRETVGGVLINRIATTRFGRRRLIGRAADYLTFYANAFWQLSLHLRRGDILIAKTDPPMLGVVLAPVAAMRGARLVNWLQDVFPEVAQAVAPDTRPLRAVFAFLKSVRDLSLRSAKLNVTIGKRMTERLAARGLSRERITEIPNWADGSFLRPVAPGENALRAAWGLGERFVVGYSGNLGRAHETAAMVDAMERLERSAPAVGLGAEARHVSWLFIGGGAQMERLREDVDRRGLTSVVTKPYQPREVLSESLSSADVHLVSLREGMEGLIVPSKFYGIAAVGRPTIFIGDEHGEIAALLREHGCGMTVPPGDGGALAAAIARLRDDPALSAEMGTRAREAFRAKFDKPVAVAAWDAALRRVAAA